MCPLADIATVLGVIFDCAQATSDQLDVHRALSSSPMSRGAGDANEQPSSGAPAAIAQSRDHVIATSRVWRRAHAVAAALLALATTASDIDKSSAQGRVGEDGAAAPVAAATAASAGCGGMSTGNRAVAACSHVDVVAACFAACKFVGTPDVAFVNLDMIAVECAHRRCASVAGSDDATSAPQQVKSTADAPRGGNMRRLFDDDDDELIGGGGAVSANERDAFVAAVIASESALLQRCGYFSSIHIAC